MTIAMTRRALLAAGMATAASPIRIAKGEGATVTPITEGLSPTEKMQRVIEAWKLSGEPMGLAPSVSAAEIREAEEQLGWSIPGSLRTLYELGNGFFGSFGVINLWALQSSSNKEVSLVFGTAWHRSVGWPLPEELVLFGDEGADNMYGIWMPGSSEEPIVVECGACFEDPCMAVAGDDIPSFLLGHSADYFLTTASDFYETEPMLDVLGVPAELRSFEREPMGSITAPDGRELGVVYIDPEVSLRLIRWANPGLPDPEPDPYDRSWTVDQINEFVASRNRGNH